MRIPRRTAIVRTPQHCGNIPESHCQRGFVTVTLPRMPWEQEITAPDRTIPRAILLSLTIITIIYTTVALVTLGTVPWQQVAGSETALTDVVSRHHHETIFRV